MAEKDVYAGEILAFTFTNRAAREMKERVGKLLGGKAAEGLTVSTFHQLGLRVLREERRAFGLKGGFSIFDAQDSQTLIKDILLQEHGAVAITLLDDADAMRERVSATASGLLTLLGIDADPLRSREHILLSNILERAWREGRSPDMGMLIREIQSPPFQTIRIADPIASRSYSQQSQS